MPLRSRPAHRRARWAPYAVPAIAAVALAACGGSDDTDTSASTAAPTTVAAAAGTDTADTVAATTAPAATTPVTTAATTTAPAATAAAPATSTVSGASAPVGVGTTAVGDVLVDARGLSLYAFLNDSGKVSACYDRCAEEWPPLLVDGPDLPAGLDATVYSVTERTDGTYQLVAGDWPLYTYFEDAAPGDVFGQGLGEVWYLLDATGALVETVPGAAATPTDGTDATGTDAAGTAAVGVAEAGDAGQILVATDGAALYGFTNDTPGTSNCYDQCAMNWPPLLVDGPDLPAGLDATVFSVTERTDGTYQLVAGDWPLYRFAADAAPGETTGQGVGGVWWLVTPAGDLITT